MKASELVKELEQVIKEHGDREVYCGGTDYPERVSGVLVRDNPKAYYPEPCFEVL